MEQVLANDTSKTFVATSDVHVSWLFVCTVITFIVSASSVQGIGEMLLFIKTEAGVRK